MIARLKQSLPLETICEGLPPVFLAMLKAVRALQFTEAPPYQEFRALLKRCSRHLRGAPPAPPPAAPALPVGVETRHLRASYLGSSFNDDEYYFSDKPSHHRRTKKMVQSSKKGAA